MPREATAVDGARGMGEQETQRGENIGDERKVQGWMSRREVMKTELIYLKCYSKTWNLCIRK